MKIEVVPNEPPALKRPAFTVDGGLAPHLDDNPILSMMNRSHLALFLGPPGSGKSSLSISMLQSRVAFKRVFHSIVVWCPPNSRESVKGGSFWDKYLPPNQVFDEVTPATLQTAHDIARENAEEKYRTLFVFDDCQRAFKEKENMRMLLNFANNRRHMRLSIWVCAQNYLAIERKLRSVVTDVFAFRMSRRELEALFEEKIERSRSDFEKILPYVFAEPHDFMYVNALTQRLFANYDELVITDG
jgi:hypothetical protein